MTVEAGGLILQPSMPISLQTTLTTQTPNSQHLMKKMTAQLQSSQTSTSEKKKPPETMKVEWRNKQADIDDRKKMAQRILQVLIRSNSKAPPNWKPQEMARRLEHNLYHSASTKESYLNLHTLRQRLQHVLNLSRKQTLAKVQAAAAQPKKESVLDEIEREAEQEEAKAKAKQEPQVKVEKVATATAAVATPTKSSTTSPEEQKKRKLTILQQRLMLLKHARSCTDATCGTTHCASFKKILAHIATCRTDKCTFTGCVMAKQLLTHYKMCRNFSCELCNCIRKPMDKMQQVEVIRRQQERLCLLRHASACSGPCKLPYCPEMKALWKHICSCVDRQCKYNHCVSSRYVLSHFKECKNPQCEVCDPVRRAIKKANGNGLKLELPTKHPAGVKRTAEQAQLSNSSGGRQNSTGGSSQSSKKQCVRAPKTMDTTYMESLSSAQLDDHIRSLRYSFSGHLSNAQLKTYMTPLLKKLMDHNFGWVFSTPVDPVALNIPDYFEVIKCPMDLGTIKKRLDGASYYSSIDAVAMDIRLTFENCIAYNDEANEFNILAKDLLRQFEVDLIELKKKIDEELEDRFQKHKDEMCQLCGGDSFKFAPSMLFCNGPCHGRIRRHSNYFSDAKNNYHWCQACYKDMKDKTPISVGEETVMKADLVKQKNSDVVEEPWVECDSCKKWYHQICALFNERNNSMAGDDEVFHCPACIVKQRRAGKPATTNTSLNASRLPHSRLSKALELRVIRALKIASEEEERRIGKPMDMSGLDSKGVAIREVLSVEKKVVVKERMKKKYLQHKQATEATYRSRCICVFQKIDGVDVLLFTLYVQEFGEKAPEPNRRRIYISYLDSVNYFQPRKFRTLMHQEVLIGCLSDAKSRGLHTAHIWSCPPLKGDDYIFFCKPENQRIPKAVRLRQWYVKLLGRCEDLDVSYGFSNLYDEYYQKLKGAHELPYFEGDYWPGLAEELIKQLEENPPTAATTEEVKPKAKKKKTTKNTAKNTKGKKNTTSTPQNQVDEVENPDILMQKFKPILQPQKGDFFVVHLNAICMRCQQHVMEGKLWCLSEIEDKKESPKCLTMRGRAPRKDDEKLNRPKKEFYCHKCYLEGKSALEARISASLSAESGKTALQLVSSDLVAPKLKTDTDVLIPCEVFDTREAFLTYCQSNHCQFDQLRRAKHSSMMILYHLFEQGDSAFTYFCSNCETKLVKGNRWSCATCLGYNVCDRCKVKTKHEHSLRPISCVPPPSSQSQGSAANKQNKPRQIDPVLLKLIEHASSCTKPNCQANCLRMRALLKHGATCKSKISGKCQTCRRILGLLKIHAQLCRKTTCSVPRCKDIRDHLARIRLQQQQMQDRRQTSLIESAVGRHT